MSGRCAACNAILTDREMTRRSIFTDEFIDLCSTCLKDTGIITYDNLLNIGPYDELEKEDGCISYDEADSDDFNIDPWDNDKD